MFELCDIETGNLFMLFDDEVACARWIIDWIEMNDITVLDDVQLINHLIGQRIDGADICAWALQFVRSRME